ncbi:MAG TPA: HAMP domain-containing sensor histidine kinase [Clostridia bacterium]|nr:HAMP domain-containing sensor histidine kinase [Clostridia bacterium]
MKFLRNPEIKKDMMIHSAIALLLAVISFLFSTVAGILVTTACIILSLLYFIPTYKRYRHIAELSQTLDQMLHEEKPLGFDEYTEGELAILKNQLQKISVALREKTDILQTERKYLSDSLADISHQIRTPLTSMNIISSMLAREDLTLEKRLELTKNLDRLLDRIDWLVTVLLKIAMLDSGTAKMKKEQVNINELIESACHYVEMPMELKDQHLVINIPAGTFFTGDLQWTAEAIGNILKNCMQHTPDVGTIYIDATSNPVFTRIDIRDEGPGIPEKDLPRLFERFYKGSDSISGGFGIGLALSKMIITNQNGTLKAMNSDHGGALFTIRFYKDTH